MEAPEVVVTSEPSDTERKVPKLPKKLKGPSALLLTPLASPISTDSYERTIEEWKSRGGKIAFIYDYVVDKYRKRLDRATLAAFLLTSLTSLLALGNFGVTEASYPELAIGIKVAVAIMTTGAAISAGVVKIFGWQGTVNNCQKYLDSVENFVALIISEQTLPMKFRTDPDQFIINQKDKYQSMLQSAPDIPHDDYVEAIERYAESKSRFRADLVNV